MFEYGKYDPANINIKGTMQTHNLKIDELVMNMEIVL